MFHLRTIHKCVVSLTGFLVLLGAVPASANEVAKGTPEPNEDALQSYDEKTKAEPLTAEEMENFYVGEVIVTGRRVANMEQAGTTTIIDSDNIAAHGDRTLVQVLKRIPGLQVAMFRKGQARLSLRGFDQRYLLILIDGVPLHDVFSTDFDISSISARNVSKIIINRGASSALYGTSGAIGTINVITKKPTEPYVQA